MRSDAHQPTPRSTFIVYGAGAILTGAGSIAFHLIGGDSVWSARLTWALVKGAMTLLLLLGPQFFIVWLIRKRIYVPGAPGVLKELLFTNAPIVVLWIAILLGRYAATTPRSTFEKLVIKPIPESVRDIDCRRSSGMDFAFWVLRFKIGTNDFHALVESQGFVQTSETDFERWRQRIRSNVGVELDFTTQWQVYTSKTGTAERRLFINTNNSDVVFVLQY